MTMTELIAFAAGIACGWCGWRIYRARAAARTRRRIREKSYAAARRRLGMSLPHDQGSDPRILRAQYPSKRQP
jgi:hypothetical protein